MGRRSTIDRLPIEVRHWLERALTENGFSGYQDLEELLHEKGFQISKSAIFRYGKKIEKRFATIKASTEAARILTEGAPDDQDKRSEAIIGIVQSELFDSHHALRLCSRERSSWSISLRRSLITGWTKYGSSPKRNQRWRHCKIVCWPSLITCPRKNWFRRWPARLRRSTCGGGMR